MIGAELVTIAERIAECRDPTDDKFLELAVNGHADLIVTGAYGHTRLGEWFFGGVTRSLLAASPVCCLMTH